MERRDLLLPLMVVRAAGKCGEPYPRKCIVGIWVPYEHLIAFCHALKK